MLGFRRFMWIILYVQFLCCTATRLSATSSEADLHHHEKISSMTTQQGLIGISNPETHKSKNLWCRRCLRIHDDEAAAPSIPAATGDPPMADLPTLPTDPEGSAGTAPPAPRTNPSSLLGPSGSPGGGVMGVGNSNKSGLANTVGISAGVGATAGVTVLLMAVLYYFKPDILLCCKTCVRVQVFHHSPAPSKK